MVYLNLDKEFFEKNMKSMEQLAVDELEEDGKGRLRFDEEINGEIEINGDIITISVDSNIGFIDVDARLDEDDYIKLIENLTKKMNKLKNIMESLKN